MSDRSDVRRPSPVPVARQERQPCRTASAPRRPSGRATGGTPSASGSRSPRVQSSSPGRRAEERAVDQEQPGGAGQGAVQRGPPPAPHHPPPPHPQPPPP